TTHPQAIALPRDAWIELVAACHSNVPGGWVKVTAGIADEQVRRLTPGAWSARQAVPSKITIEYPVTTKPGVSPISFERNTRYPMSPVQLTQPSMVKG